MPIKCIIIIIKAQIFFSVKNPWISRIIPFVSKSNLEKVQLGKSHKTQCLKIIHQIPLFRDKKAKNSIFFLMRGFGATIQIIFTSKADHFWAIFKYTIKKSNNMMIIINIPIMIFQMCCVCCFPSLHTKKFKYGSWCTNRYITQS